MRSAKGRGCSLCAAADAIGVRGLLVHALSDDAKGCYLKFGFRESPIEPMTLMVTLDELKWALSGLLD